LIRRICLLTLFLFSPWLSGFKFIPNGASEEILTQAQTGQSLIFNRKYEEAQQFFSQLATQYPDSPLGTFGQMAILNAQMFENFDFTLDPEFDQIQQKNKTIVDKIEKDKNSSAWDNFLCGASSGLRGFYYVRKDAYFRALREAKQARNCLDRALEKDPRFLDADLGLGLYDYWTGVFANRFKFFPIFKDKRQQGINETKTAIDQGTIASELAKAALVFVYHDAQNAKDGLPLTQELIQAYPQNIIMRNIQGNFLSLLGRHTEAQASLDEVLKLDPKVNVARYFKALDYYRAGNTKESQHWFEDFLKNQPTPAWQAYAYYMLGTIELRNNNRQKAFDNFKAGYKAYDNYTPNLKMILKMRNEEK